MNHLIHTCLKRYKATKEETSIENITDTRLESQQIPHTGINMIYNLTRVKYPKRTVSQV